MWKESDIGRSLQLFASYNPKAGLLDRVDNVLFLDRFRIEEYAGLLVAVGDGRHLHPGFFFDERLDRICAGVAVHAFDFEYCGFHLMLSANFAAWFLSIEANEA